MSEHQEPADTLLVQECSCEQLMSLLYTCRVCESKARQGEKNARMELAQCEAALDEAKKLVCSV